MKKLFILFAASVFTLAANAQIAQVSKKQIHHEKHMVKKEERKEMRQLEGSEPTYQSKEAFLGDFGNIPNASWKRDKFFDVVTFTKDGVSQTAYYDAGSALVGTVINKSFSDLPASAQKEINKKYAGYQKGKVIMFDDNESNSTDMMLYETWFDDADNYFIELQKGTTYLILKVNMEGNVSFFKEMKV